MTTTKTTGLVKIGEWGYVDSTRGSGNWYAKPEDADAVRQAYEDMDSDDMGPDCDHDIKAAGGIFIAD